MQEHISKDLKRFNYLITETDNVYHEAAARLGLSDSAMQILYAICDYDEGDSCPLREVVRRTGISKQTVNSAIRKMEREGILYLEQDGVRMKKLCLTQKGKELAERTALRIIKAENNILDSWFREDVEKYLELTERFLTSFKEEVKNWGIRADRTEPEPAE